MPTFTGTPATTDTLYCTLAQIKAADVLNISNTNHDAILEACIDGASRGIDNEVARRFYNTTETRYYTAKKTYALTVDDIASESGITIYTDDNSDGTYENTWSSSDYYLAPYNSITNGNPFELIETTPTGVFRFPVGVPKGVKITAPFGFPTIPSTINDACKLQAVIIFKSYITPLGVSAATSVGEIREQAKVLDDRVKWLIRSYLRVNF